jgi:hypothetical protein
VVKDAARESQRGQHFLGLFIFHYCCGAGSVKADRRRVHDDRLRHSFRSNFLRPTSAGAQQSSRTFVIDDTSEKTGQIGNKIDKVSPESFRRPRETRMYAQLRVKRFLDTQNCFVPRRLRVGTDRRPARAVAGCHIPDIHLITCRPRKAAAQCADHYLPRWCTDHLRAQLHLKRHPAGNKHSNRSRCRHPASGRGTCCHAFGPRANTMSSVPCCRGLGLTTSSWDRMPTPTPLRGFCCFPGKLRKKKYPSHN